MKMSKAKDVDYYITNSVIEAQPILKELQEMILSTFPKAEEGISWGVPFYKYHGNFAGFATYKKQVTFGIAPGVLESKDRKIKKENG